VPDDDATTTVPPPGGDERGDDDAVRSEEPSDPGAAPGSVEPTAPVDTADPSDPAGASDPADRPAPSDDADAGSAADGAGARLRSGAAEGARAIGDRVAGAAGATARSLRDADVERFAHQTTSLIENARPFFLAAFAVAFTTLAFFEDHVVVALVFALGAILFVLGASYSREVDAILTRRAADDADD